MWNIMKTCPPVGNRNRSFTELAVWIFFNRSFTGNVNLSFTLYTRSSDLACFLIQMMLLLQLRLWMHSCPCCWSLRLHCSGSWWLRPVARWLLNQTHSNFTGNSAEQCRRPRASGTQQKYRMEALPSVANRIKDCWNLKVRVFENFG